MRKAQNNRASIFENCNGQIVFDCICYMESFWAKLKKNVIKNINLWQISTFLWLKCLSIFGARFKWFFKKLFPLDKFWQITNWNLPLNTTLHCIWYEQLDIYCIHSVIFYCKIKSHVLKNNWHRKDYSHKLLWLSKTLTYVYFVLPFFLLIFPNKKRIFLKVFSQLKNRPSTN